MSMDLWTLMALSYLSAQNKDQRPYCVPFLTDQRIKVNKWADVKGSVGGKDEEHCCQEKRPSQEWPMHQSKTHTTQMLPKKTLQPPHNSHSSFFS